MAKEMVKAFHGNKLEQLWNDIWAKKTEKTKTNHDNWHHNMGFSGQRINKDRQRKKAMMRSMGITDKQYRRNQKGVRRTERLEREKQNG